MIDRIPYPRRLAPKSNLFMMYTMGNRAAAFTTGIATVSYVMPYHCREMRLKYKIRRAVIEITMMTS